MSTFRHNYGPHPSQFGLLSLPDSAPPYRVVVLLHGGFWHTPWGLDLMFGIARDLVTQGMAVWNLEYRRIGEPGGGWPGTFDDIVAGVDALAGLPRAAELDLQHAGAAGHSAGGHLALWLAAERGPATGGPVTLTRTVCLAGVPDLRKAWERQVGAEAVEALLGGSPDAQPARCRRASPAERLPLGLPQLVVHGQRDRVVPPELSRDYAEAALLAGDPVTLHIAPRAAHMDVINPRNPAWRMTAAWLAEPTPRAD